MQRFVDYYRDTDPRALEVFLSRQRQMTIAQKMNAVVQMSEMLWGLAECGARQMYPQAGDREIFLRTAARFHDRGTMMRVYSCQRIGGAFCAWRGTSDSGHRCVGGDEH
jgi:hypothetical protein